MDRKEAILRIKEHMKHHGIGKYPHLKLKEALDMAIAALSQPNEPLTLDELREMDGEPVWDENGKCYLVDTTYRFCSCSDIEIAIVYKNGDVKRYPQRRALYRRPPEGEEDINV